MAWEKAEKLHNTKSMTVAQTQQLVARTMMSMQRFLDDQYYQHARSAWDQATQLLEEDHPRLAPYMFTLGKFII